MFSVELGPQKFSELENIPPHHYTGTEYCDTSETEQAPVDLHNKEFCVDVSAYKPLKWVEREGESCKTEFVKKCEEKRENVCAKVVETQCEVVPYTECSLGMEDQTYSETELAPKLFVEKSCVQGHKTVPHIKQVSHLSFSQLMTRSWTNTFLAHRTAELENNTWS